MRTPKSLLAAAALSTAALSAPSIALAQNLYVTANRTIALGNPVNGNFGQVYIGADAALNPFPNLSADLTGGTATFIGAVNGSTVNISNGTFAAPSSPGTLNGVLSIFNGSTVNLSGGTLSGYISVGAYGPSGGVNRLAISGGTITGYIENGPSAILDITGGSVIGTGLSGQVNNTGDGTINLTGGAVNAVYSGGYLAGGTINIGGTAVVGRVGAYDGLTNIDGGTIGAGGVSTISPFGGPGGVANFTGSGLTVSQVSTGGFFDENNYVNLIVADYTISGTLASGTAVNTTVRAGANYSNTGAQATFNPADLAPDRYVTANQTVTGIYNNIIIGVDETGTVSSNPTATIAAGADTVFLTTRNQSITNMTGGIVRGDVTLNDQSQFNLSGGAVGGGIYNAAGTSVNISGGAAAYVGVGGTTTISGGAVELVELLDAGTLIVEGSGLSSTASAPVGHLWDANSGTNFINAARFQVTGSLSDGTPFDQNVLASGASGSSGQQTLTGPQTAPNLALTTNAATSTIYNRVEIGSATTSPTVIFAAGTDVGNVFVRNQSTLQIQDGVVNGTISAGANTTINISGGNVSRLYHFPQSGGNGAGRVTITGGVTSYIAPGNQLLMTGGTLGTLDTYGGARVRIEGGNLSQMWLYGGSAANPTNVVITDGSVGTIDYRGFGLNVVSILGGSIGQIWGNGGFAYIHGGAFGADGLLNYRPSTTLFDLFGQNLSASNATPGSYTDNFGTAHNGVWWTVTGTLESGAPLSTRYFERDGSLSAPTGLVFNVVPSPGAATLLGVCGLLAVRRRRRRR